MQLSVTGRNLQVTEALKDHVEKKFSRLERYFDSITNTHVILSLEKLSHRAEATMHVPRTELVAFADADDMYVAIDKMIDKLHRQMTKYKERMHAHR